MTRRKVMIHILTHRAGLTMPPFFEDVYALDHIDEQGDNAHIENLFACSEDEPEVSELLVEGRLVTTTHRVELLYVEDFSSDMGTSTTRIGFDRAAPELITMLRSGAVSTALVFENKRRNICIYNAPSVGFEICISTVKVENELLEKGRLTLDYYVEIHGTQTDHCKLEITVRDAED